MKSRLQGAGIRCVIGAQVLLLALLLPAAEAAAACPEQQPRDCCYGPVQPGQTLWSIAQTLRPGQDVSVQQTAVALRRLNPEAFEEGNLYRLMACSYLRIPKRQDALQVSRQFAVAELLRHQRLLAAAAPAAGSTSPVASVPAAHGSSLTAAAVPTSSIGTVLPATAGIFLPGASTPTSVTAAAAPGAEAVPPAAAHRRPEMRAREPRRAVSHAAAERSFRQILMERLDVFVRTGAWRSLAGSPLLIALLLVCIAYMLLFLTLRLLGSGRRSAAGAQEDCRALLNRARLLMDVPQQQGEAQRLLYGALLSEEEDIRREASALLALIAESQRSPGPS